MARSLQKFFSGTFIARTLSILLVLAGLMNIVSTLWHMSSSRFELLQDAIPLAVSHVSRALTLLLGSSLLILARGIWQKKHRSWWIACVVLVFSAILHLIRGLDIEASSVLLVLFIILLSRRSMFVVQSARVRFSGSIKFSFFVLLFLFLYTAFGSLAFEQQFIKPVTLSVVGQEYVNAVFGLGQNVLQPQTRTAHWFEYSVEFMGFVSIVAIISALFAPYVTREVPSDEERRRTRRLVLLFGEDSTSYMSLMDGKRLFFSHDRDSVVAYAIANGVAVALGSPIGKSESLPLTIKEFRDAMEVHGLSVVFLGISEASKSAYENAGFSTLKVGEEATISTATFSLEGSVMANVRHAVTKMQREGCRYEWYPMNRIPWNVMNAIETLHRSWLLHKKGPALTFSGNFFPFPDESEAEVLTIFSRDNKLQGAFSFFPCRQSKGMALELMLRHPKSTHGIVEAAIVESVSHGKMQGKHLVSLGVAPLSDTDVAREKPFAEKGLGMVMKNLNQVYGYQSLFDFKKKFQPNWTNIYLVMPRLISLPKVALAVVHAHLRYSFFSSIFRSRKTKESTNSG